MRTMAPPTGPPQSWSWCSTGSLKTRANAESAAMTSPAIQPSHQDRAARHDQRHAGRKPEDDQARLDGRGVREIDLRRRAFGRCRNRNHVVETHHDVGDRNDPYRAPEGVRTLHRLVLAVGI